MTKIKTPFMILQGTADGAVDWDQGLEFFNAARRNGKEVIFLSYPNEPHHLAIKENQKDFQIRMKQFFDHYLMGCAGADVDDGRRAADEEGRADSDGHAEPMTHRRFCMRRSSAHVIARIALTAALAAALGAPIASATAQTAASAAAQTAASAAAQTAASAAAQTAASASAQAPLKVLNLADYGRWSRITSTGLSADGKWMSYAYQPNEGDGTLYVKQLDGDKVFTIPIGSAPAAAGGGGGAPGGAGGGVQFSDDSRFVAYYVNPPDAGGGRGGRGGGGGGGGGRGGAPPAQGARGGAGPRRCADSKCSISRPATNFRSRTRARSAFRKARSGSRFV